MSNQPTHYVGWLRQIKGNEIGNWVSVYEEETAEACWQKMLNSKPAARCEQLVLPVGESPWKVPQ